MAPSSETVARETDPEVSARTVAMGAPVDAAEAPRPMPTKQTGAEPLLNVSETTANRPWPRISCRAIAVAFRLPLGVSASASETEIARGRETGIMIGLVDLGATTTRTTTENAGIGKRNVNGSIVAALIEVRMTNSPMAMKNRQVPGAVAPTTKTTTLAEIHGIPRYVY